MDRNQVERQRLVRRDVALRKESVDRNARGTVKVKINRVALRKESVDRNCYDVSD